MTHQEKFKEFRTKLASLLKEYDAEIGVVKDIPKIYIDNHAYVIETNEYGRTWYEGSIGKDVDSPNLIFTEVEW